MLPDRRGMSAASSPVCQNGVSRLAATGRSEFREQIDGLGWPRASLCIATRDPRDEARVPRAGWPAGPGPIFRHWQEGEGGIRRRMRRPPGGESGRRWRLGMEPSVRAAGTYGARLGGPDPGHRLGNGGCCEVGEAAGECCLTQPRATINMSRTTGPCGRPVTYAAARRRGHLPHWKRQSMGVGQAGSHPMVGGTQIQPVPL
jgi:hypothetical protein